MSGPLFGGRIFGSMGRNMVMIQLDSDKVDAGIWWMKWVEKNEIIGCIIHDKGCYRITPQGPHWSPMKSFAGLSFDGPERGLAEVELYFRGR